MARKLHNIKNINIVSDNPNSPGMVINGVDFKLPTEPNVELLNKSDLDNSILYLIDDATIHSNTLGKIEKQMDGIRTSILDLSKIYINKSVLTTICSQLDSKAPLTLVDQVNTINLSLENYATKTELTNLDTEVKKKINTTDVETNYVTKTELTNLDTEVKKKINTTDVETNYATKTEVKSVVTYNTTSENIKIWSGVVICDQTAGFFNVDFSSAGFSSPPHVQATAFSRYDSSDTSANNANWTCIMKGSVTNIGCSGRAKTADSAGLLAAMVATNAGNTIEVNILAIGK